MEDRERAVVAGVWQGVSITLAAMQLRIDQEFCQVEPRFLDHAEQAELVGDFAATAATIV